MSARPRHYPKAPIREALIDFRFPQQTIALEKLQKFGSEIASSYPNKATREVFQNRVTLTGPQPSHQASRALSGYVFHTEDRLQAVQARVDGFTFSRFAPYEDWDHMIKEGERLWSVFLEIANPTNVTRVAVRYINEINIPFSADGSLRFEDYLRTFVTIGIEEDVDLEQFFIRLVMPQMDIGAQLILTETLLPPQGDKLRILLDIDLFRENLSLDARSKEIWDILETFRSRKNRFFEGSITDLARRLFT